MHQAADRPAERAAERLVRQAAAGPRHRSTWPPTTSAAPRRDGKALVQAAALLTTCWQGGPRAHRPARRGVRSRPSTRRWHLRPDDAEPTGSGRAAGGRGHAGRLPLEGAGPAPGHGAWSRADGDRSDGHAVAAPTRVVREGLLQDARRVRARPPTRRSPTPTGSWPSSTTPTPTRVGGAASRRSPRPTTCSAMRPAQGVRRGPPVGPAARPSAAAGSRRLRRRRAAAPSASTTSATSATSSAACSAAAGGARARPGPSAARTSRPSSTCRSRTPSTG